MNTAYKYDSRGIYIGSAEFDPEGALPAGSTTLQPPSISGGKVAQWTGGAWVVLDSAPPSPSPDWPALIAARRFQVETGGVTVQGIPVNTERESQALLTGAAFAASLDPDYRIKWKATTGFVELSGAQVIGLASQVRAFVQTCFNREAELLGAVADGSITAEMLEEGWPA